jgi:hypothetical protein
MLRQVVYISSATQHFSPEALEELLARARANNERSGITGILLHHDLTFLQIIEGTRDDVDRLMARIRRDPSHTSLRIVQDESISERDFKSWAMACRIANAEEARVIANPPLKLDRGFISSLVPKLSSPVAQVFVDQVARAGALKAS